MKNLFLLGALVLFLYSCSKNDTNYYQMSDVVGVWDGQYSSTIGGNMFDNWLFHFKQDSSVLVYSNPSDTANSTTKGVGKFTIFDNQIIAIFRWGNIAGYYISAEISPSKTRISGMWGIGNEDKGETFLDKH